MKWLVTPPHNAPVIVETDDCTAFEVRQFVERAFIDGGKIEPTDSIVSDIQLRWIGSDANHGGTPKGRRMQVRSYVGGPLWTPWEDA